MSYFRMFVAALGEHHAGHGGISTHDYEEEDGDKGGAYLFETAADTFRLEIDMAYTFRARFRKIRLRVSRANGHY